MEKAQKRIKLKQFRVGLDLTQEQMAEKLGVTRTTYTLIENGQRYGRLDFWNKLEKTFSLSGQAVYEMMTEIKF